MSRQTFKTTSVLRLEVEDTPTGLVNLVTNPRGELGGWGWLTAITGTAVNKFGNTNAIGGLQYVGPNPSAPSSFTTEEIGIAAGQYAAAYIVSAGGTSQWFRVRFEWLNSAKTVLSSSTQSAYSSGTFGTPMTYAAVQAPASTVYMRLRFDIYGNTSGANPSAAAAFNFDQIAVAKAATAAALTGLTYANSATTYTNVLGPTHTISVKRDELNLGTLTAEILDATIDPSQSTLVRLGKRCRLMALDNVTATFTPIFTGKVSRGETSYNPKRTDAKRARITMTALDDTTTLAQVTRPSGVATINELRDTLEGCGVPWNVNGSGNQYLASPTIVTTNPDAKAVDQIAVTRDSVLGYAWVSRRGVVNVWDRASIGTTSVATISESVYSDVSLDYDTDRCINSVTVKLRRINLANGSTAEVTYGPYLDQASIDQWGIHEATFTVQGITDSDAAAAAYAAPILTANATPAVRINSASIPIRSTADIVGAKALLDLYDMVTVVNTNAGISTNMRVTGLEHTIESGKWTLGLDFTVAASVAIPQDVIAVGGLFSLNAGGPAVGPSSDTAWASLTVSNMTSGTCQYCRRSGTVFVEMSGLKSGTNGTLLATLPVGFRPSIGVIRPSLQTGGVLAGVVVGADGTIKSDFGTGAYGGFSFPV